MARLSVAAVLALAFAPNALAVEKTVALEGLKQIAELKSMDMDDVICDECLEEIDCIWPCELACVLNVPEAFAGKVCQVCLEYFGCEGCKFMCPTPDTDAPTLFPSEVPTQAPTLNPTPEPSYGPTATPAKVPTPTPSAYPTAKPSVAPTAAPQADPTFYPTYAPTGAPTEAPSTSPTLYPTYNPTGAPTLNPTVWPSPKPTYFPTSAPTAAPSVVPTAAPTIPPTGAPSVTPEFYIYYTVEDYYLYAYNVIQDTTELYAEANFTGDLKIDSPNKFMFWSDPQKGHIIKQDMTDGKATAIVTGKPVMGLSVDPSRGELYFANQGAGEENGFAGSAIEIIDYAGSNVSVVHSLEDYGLEPYSVECDPSFVIVDFNLDDPGILLFTAHDGTEGFIYQANLFGGLLEKVYTTTTLDIFGLILDAESSMMWWIEHRGVANGVYNAMLEDTPEATYVTYLEESYWLAAVWDYDLMYTTDYKEGIVYEMTLSQTTGEFDNIVALAYATKPRCLGFYYGGDTGDEDGISSTVGSSSKSPHPLDAPQGAPGTAQVALPDTPGTASTPSALKPEPEVEDLAETGEATTGTVPTGTYMSVGALVAAVVAGVVYKRRNAKYQTISNEEEFSI